MALFDLFVSRIVSRLGQYDDLQARCLCLDVPSGRGFELSKRSEAIVAACEQIRKNPKPDATYRELDKAAPFLDRARSTCTNLRNPQAARRRHHAGDVRDGPTACSRSLQRATRIRERGKSRFHRVRGIRSPAARRRADDRRHKNLRRVTQRQAGRRTPDATSRHANKPTIRTARSKLNCSRAVSAQAIRKRRNLSSTSSSRLSI